MAREVKGITVLVTGAATGLGFSMVQQFLEDGARQVIIADLDQQGGSRALETIRAKYGDNRVTFYKCDVTKDLDCVFGDVIAKHGCVDLLINNAGVFCEKDFKRTIDVNTTAVIAWSMKFYDVMRKDRGGKGGTIINISSIYGFRISPYTPFYHASKFAVLGFSRSLGHQRNFDRTGVRVVALCPGLTVTSLSTVNLQIREDDDLDDFIEEGKKDDWQTADFLARGAVAVFQQAESGEAWLVEGQRPAEKLNF